MKLMTEGCTHDRLQRSSAHLKSTYVVISHCLLLCFGWILEHSFRDHWLFH